MKRALTAAVLSALATAAVLATVGFGAANKSSTTKKSSTKGKSSQTTTATKPPPTMKEALAAEEKQRAANQEKLAKSLGVSVDKLQSALDAVKKKNLDQAVKDNLLTAEQRDAILACDKAPLTCDRSNLPAYGFGGGHGHFGGPGGPVAPCPSPVAPACVTSAAAPRAATPSSRTSRQSSASPRTRSPRRSRPTGRAVPSSGSTATATVPAAERAPASARRPRRRRRRTARTTHRLRWRSPQPPRRRAPAGTSDDCHGVNDPLVLVVDDDAAIREALERALRLEGFAVATAGGGRAALAEVARQPPAAIVLDVTMPDLGGRAVCARLRADGLRTPILILSARDEVEDRVAGLQAGADDYLVKPFAVEELVARLRALLRRGGEVPAVDTSAELTVADLRIDPAARSVRRAAREIELTRREFELLEVFARNAGIVLSRDRLLELVWGYDWAADGNVVDVFVSYLRRKLEAGGEPRLIQTVRGVGFVLREAQT